MRRLFTAMVFALTCLTTLFAQAAPASEPNITAASAILVEASTGRILYEKNANEQLPPASMTKMLTCIIALEKLNPLEEVFVTPEVMSTEDNTLPWEARDSLAAKDMVTAVMLVSENGGAVALAQTTAGSVAQFADMMNAKAREIGCTHSNFVNPNGLPDTQHYSTAADMARIAVYCMKNVDFRNIVETRRTSVKWIYPKEKWSELNNTNELLGKFNGANGIKTGWTTAAGGCLAASAKRDDVELIAIVMRSADTNTRFDDAAKLLNYGFERVRMIEAVDASRVEKKVFVRGGEQATVIVSAQQNLMFPLLADEDAKLLTVTYDLPKIVEAGFDEGDTLGEAIVCYDGKPVARVPLVAREGVAEGFSFGSLFVTLFGSFIV